MDRTRGTAAARARPEPSRCSEKLPPHAVTGDRLVGSACGYRKESEEIGGALSLLDSEPCSRHSTGHAEEASDALRKPSRRKGTGLGHAQEARSRAMSGSRRLDRLYPALNSIRARL